MRSIRGDEYHGWEVTTKATAKKEFEVERFDAVIAANGHCDWPLLPEIEGLNAWSKEYPESLHHSVSYKNTKAFENKVSDRSISLRLTCWSNCFLVNFTDKVSVSFL